MCTNSKIRIRIGCNRISSDAFPPLNGLWLLKSIQSTSILAAGRSWAEWLLMTGCHLAAASAGGTVTWQVPTWPFYGPLDGQRFQATSPPGGAPSLEELTQWNWYSAGIIYRFRPDALALSYFHVGRHVPLSSSLSPPWITKFSTTTTATTTTTTVFIWILINLILII